MRIWLEEGKNKSGLTQYKIAQATEIDQSYITRLKNGDYDKPDPDRIIKIGRFIAENFTQDEDEIISYINRGLDIFGYKGLPAKQKVEANLAQKIREYLEMGDEIKKSIDFGGISQNQPSERLEGDTPLINSGDMLAKGGISPGETSAAIPINSGERGEGLDDAPQEGLIAFNVTTDLLPPLKPGLHYPVIRWDGETLISGDILLVKSGEGYEAKRYAQDADAEGLDKETTFVVIGRAY